MADYQILWTRQEEPDPKFPDFIHILEVGVADSVGDYLGAWPVRTVIDHIKAGDRFIVTATIWDQVHVVRRQHANEVREFIQTAGNKLDVTNLKYRHQHGPPPTESTVKKVRVASTGS